jgi:hypothetical protein
MEIFVLAVNILHLQAATSTRLKWSAWAALPVK